ncbi:E3 ubiquitin-protein ligase Rnf220-like [Sitophilus oryzae]|uniref:E3 ubiquitin-protein ligase Rnf220-like n=1 Tax=Sitophilus oryzae TaxID=7048 RepID=A0A6J2XX60_SITOR|nr:E3 ubiquitin-protein ligase Rnf220-like [Sitophilus oryzae]
MEIFDNSGVPSTSYNFEESGRGCRAKKKQIDPACCPVCSVTLRQSEIHSHLCTEIEKLGKLPSVKHRLNGKSTPSSSNGHSSIENGDCNKNWETYQKVKNNRQNRQRTKTRKRKIEEQTCPICNKEVSEDITIHVELCLRRTEQNGSDQDDENIDIETFEEYEWAGQSRVRATSLMQGGLSNLGTPIQLAEEDEDLNVDGDGDIYGSPQYSEQDIILPCEDAAENQALRKAVVGTSPNKLNLEEKQEASNSAKNKGDPVLEALKNRIRDLESRLESKNDIYKCLICMERYTTPVISVCCWHVHCEQCWLQTLGAKKLCPQCNMITSASDLRRIYI